jgi:hypothetical protein
MNHKIPPGLGRCRNIKVERRLRTRETVCTNYANAETFHAQFFSVLAGKTVTEMPSPSQ